MPRQHKPKTRRHLCIALVKVKRFPNGILSALPITKSEFRLMNVADVTKPGREPRRKPAMLNNTTSRCLRVKREAQAFAALPAVEQGKSILSRVGSAFARANGLAT